MNQSTLEKANELSKRIYELKKIIKYWETAKAFILLQRGENFSREVNVSDDAEFNVFKRKKIEELEARLAKVEHEFKIL